MNKKKVLLEKLLGINFFVSILTLLLFISSCSTIKTVANTTFEVIDTTLGVVEAVLPAAEEATTAYAAGTYMYEKYQENETFPSEEYMEKFNKKIPNKKNE